MAYVLIVLSFVTFQSGIVIRTSTQVTMAEFSSIESCRSAAAEIQRQDADFGKIELY